MNFFMSQIMVLLTLLLFLGCGEPPQNAAAPSPPVEETSREARHTIEYSRAYDEASVVKAAGLLARTGQALDSATAETCWKKESSRPMVASACILAWSLGDQPSTTLNDFLRGLLHSNSRISRIFAIAAARKPGLAAALSYEEFLSLLSSLTDEPSWLRGKLIRAWMEKRNVGLVIQSELWHRLGLSNQATDPASLAEAYGVGQLLGNSWAQTLLSDYCSPGFTGVAQSRCWRAISSLVDPATGEGLDEEILPLLQNRKNSGWILFERSFPERALLLKRYL